ncbi:A/G-specific adenine glycosylase [Pseudidiomarina atlantica]|jgi:A/G-specific adenine glycosylase|uniref:A/G-specific adenine glycosylase n=1 Tax=Pseudidiomarina atlantica TaxID=1517416 RepID=UPI00068FAFAA|nr:A/G-specific adenine glycosylase [Pseudidiomarina atlantica]
MTHSESFIEKAKACIQPERFTDRVVRWQVQHGRNDLPWQQAGDPYHVLVSELMLQQTQVSTVIPYFQRWLNALPSFHALAAADEQTVMQLWQGLGYYRRARNLHAAAQTVVAQYAGQLPHQADELREIPGIGPYTVGAIRAFAFDQPAAIVDGNVKRLFARLFMLPFLVNKATDDKHFWQLAEVYKPLASARRFAQGLLDLGATICKPQRPLCEQCPLADVCLARAHQATERFPQRAESKKTPTKPGYFVLDANADGVLLEQRSATGIWPSLWCLPELPSAPNAQAPQAEFKHTFTHYKLAAQVYLTANSNISGKRIAWRDLEQYGLPAPIAKFLNNQARKLVCQSSE